MEENISSLQVRNVADSHNTTRATHKFFQEGSVSPLNRLTSSRLDIRISSKSSINVICWDNISSLATCFKYTTGVKKYFFSAVYHYDSPQQEYYQLLEAFKAT